MRAALWFLTLFAIAAAIALVAGNNQATVTLYWPPYRVDLSLNLVVLIMVALFALGHFALQAFNVLFSLPKQAKRWRVLQKERALLMTWTDALAQMNAGRYVRARNLAKQALEHEKDWVQLDPRANQGPEIRAMLNLLVAENAQLLQDHELRDRHLNLAQAQIQNALGHRIQTVREALQLRQARWVLDQRDPKGALELLGRLSQGVARRTQALRIRLKAARLAGRSQLALDTARTLIKHRAISGLAAQSLLKSLILEVIQDAKDGQQLEQAWIQLESSEQRIPEVAIRFTQRLLNLSGQSAVARSWLLLLWADWLASLRGSLNKRVGNKEVNQDSQWTDSTQQQYVQVWVAALSGIDVDSLARIDKALQLQPMQPLLLFLAAQAYMERQLWGKAQQFFQQCQSAPLPNPMKMEVWRALAKLAEQRGDVQTAADAWRQAGLMTLD